MKHCLIVDDSAVIRKVAKRIIESLSLRTSEAEDGMGGLAACREEMPDAVIVDSVMPVLDGCEFVRELRRMPGGDKPKIVLCTTENDLAVITRAIRAGADDFMLKPFDTGILSGKLREIGLV
jgi:two-component system, chemotaxis family, chemotaxis protein CheY